MREDFENLPAHARLYIFAASRPLRPEEALPLLDEVDRFITEWQSHREGVVAARDWRYDRFLLIGVDETETRLSGCSIDGMVHRLKAIENRLGISLVDSAPVLFREGTDIERLDRETFRRRVQEGRVRPDTTVFNNTLLTVGELRQGKWEVPFGESWHSRAFAKATSARTGAE
jgi:hypothetical protein